MPALLDDVSFHRMLKTHKKVRASTWQGKAHRVVGKTTAHATSSTSTAAAAAALQDRRDVKAGMPIATEEVRTSLWLPMQIVGDVVDAAYVINSTMIA